jgi:hypothetical protein
MLSEREELLKTLRAGPLILRTLVRGLDDAAVRRRPRDGEWAVVEVVGHLADTERRAIGRLQQMLDEEEPFLPAYDPDRLAEEHRYIELDLAPALDRFERLRADHVAALENLDDAGWRRVGRHEENGRMTVQLQGAHIAGEDGNHLAQIARLISG